MWEDCGEINLLGGISFLNVDVPAIKDELNRLAELLTSSDGAEISVEIAAVPDGENDYDFASVAFSYDGEAVHDVYCRF